MRSIRHYIYASSVIYNFCIYEGPYRGPLIQGCSGTEVGRKGELRSEAARDGERPNGRGRVKSRKTKKQGESDRKADGEGDLKRHTKERCREKEEKRTRKRKIEKDMPPVRREVSHSPFAHIYVSSLFQRFCGVYGPISDMYAYVCMHCYLSGHIYDSDTNLTVQVLGLP